MKELKKAPLEKFPDSHHDVYSKTVFGFWLYILTDFMLFATLFAAYAVLHNSTYGGPPAKDILSLDTAYIQSHVFLISTLFISFSGMYAHRRQAKLVNLTLIVTLLLGFLFLFLQFHEFHHLLQKGHSWVKSGYLSAYYTVVGMHTLHVVLGLIWIVLLIGSTLSRGITPATIRRVVCMKMFWQFLNIIWVFIFAIIYLLGFI